MISLVKGMSNDQMLLIKNEIEKYYYEESEF